MQGDYSIKELMKAYGVMPKKGLGQNFLNDVRIVREIVSNADITKDDLVIEVGPGLGVMTSMLAEQAGYVAAIEIDRELIKPLTAVTKIYDNVEICCADVMKLDIGALIDRYEAEHGVRSVKVVANLPYYITTPIIMMFLEQYSHRIRSLTFMIQKEVAERICAAKGKEYGAVTIAIAYYTEPHICFTVPRTAFVPQPNVDSAVIRLDVRSEPPFVLKNEDFYFRVVRASFNQRRKMLTNSLANASVLGVSREQVSAVLEEMGKDIRVRGEALSPAEFATLSDRLYELTNDTNDM